MALGTYGAPLGYTLGIDRLEKKLGGMNTLAFCSSKKIKKFCEIATWCSNAVKNQFLNTLIINYIFLRKPSQCVRIDIFGQAF